MKTLPLMLLLLVIGGVLGLLGTPLFTQEPKGSTPATKAGPTDTPPPPTDTPPQAPTAELVWPSIRTLRPTSGMAGDRIEVEGSGGYYYTKSLGLYDESAQSFPLYFDDKQSGSIGCYVNSCSGSFIVPIDTSPGQYYVKTAGGRPTAFIVNPTIPQPSLTGAPIPPILIPPPPDTPVRLIPPSFPQGLDIRMILELENAGISPEHIAKVIEFMNCNDLETIGKDEAEGMLIALRSGSSVDTGCGPTRKIVSSEGLVGYWSFDENSGETALDSSGYDHDGTMVGLPNRVPGRPGTAFSLDGIANYVTIPDTRDLQLSSTQTVSTWYKWDGGSRNQWRRLVGKGDFLHRNYGLWIKPQRGLILFQIWEPVSGRINGCEALNSDITFDNDWHHLAASYDSGTFKLYHDGRLVQPPNQCYNTPPNTDHPVTIGFATGATGPWGDDDNAPFDGAIDEVHIFNRVLSDCEVAELAEHPC